MKKRIKMLLLGFLPLLVQAQLSGYGYQSGIVVEHLSAWASDYLTVIDTRKGMMVEGDYPPVMSVIKKVNGSDAKGMLADDFEELQKNGNIHELEYDYKHDGEIKTKKINYKASLLWTDIEPMTPATKPDNINIFSDPEVDFYQYNTFDFVLEAEDKLTDKSIANKIGEVFIAKGLKRTSDNPDILIKMRKYLNQATNSVYVPESKQVVTTGATTQTSKNLFTGKPVVNTKLHNTVVTSGGYTHTGVSATFHLELEIFDAKKIAAGVAEGDAMVWKLDFNKFASEAIEIMDVVTNEIMYWCYNYPFNNNVYSYNILTLGAAFRSEDDAISGHIYKIFDGSPLANVGFESGDRLVKAYVGGFSCLVYSGPRRVFFKEGADLDDKRWGLLWVYCIPYAPLYTKQRADYLTSMPAGFGRVHYKLEGKYGMKHLKISQSDFPDKKGTAFTSQYISRNTVNRFLRY